MLTVTAKDSSTAMDEIVSKLGSDAMIVSTRRVETGIEITATSDILDLKTRLKKREGDLDSSLSNRAAIDKDKAGNVGNGKLPTLNGIDENLKADFLNDIKVLFDKYQGHLTPSSKEINFLSDILLKQTENSRFQIRFSRNQYSREKFIEIFSRDIVDIDHPDYLNTSNIYIVGPSGSGKSTFAAKLVYMLKEKFSNSEFLLLEANRNKFVEQSILSFCAKITGLQYRDNVKGITNDDTIKIFEMDLDTFVNLQKTKKLKSDTKIFLIVPAGANQSMITTILQKFKKIKPKVVLTKLDECDVNFDQIVEIFNFDCKLSFLSANAKLSEGLCFATHEIMGRFLNDRISEGTNK